MGARELPEGALRDPRTGEIYHETLRRTCPACGMTPLQPAICLLCGECVCAASDCCRKDGDEGCTRHAQTHHGGLSAFLVVRRADTLLVLGRRHTWWGSLYLDAHGEEDHGLRRGKPLFLSPARVAAMHRLWLAQAVPLEVARSRAAASHAAIRLALY